MVVDRVAPTGTLAAVEEGPAPLFRQFPLACQLSRQVAEGPTAKVVAFKGYLRPDALGAAVLSMAEARTYLGGAEGGRRHAGGAAPCAASGTPDPTEDLLPLTPYSRYWQFYRAPDVTGNVFQWDVREAPRKVRINSFKWREGLGARLGAEIKRYRRQSAACGGGANAALQQAERVLTTVATNEGVDITHPPLKCQLAGDPLLPATLE